jgi:hypothetical protein
MNGTQAIEFARFVTVAQELDPTKTEEQLLRVCHLAKKYTRHIENMMSYEAYYNSHAKGDDDPTSDKIEAQITKSLGPKFVMQFDGDPRGYTVKIMNSTRNSAWGGGYGIPEL